MSAKLGEILVRENLITSQQLREALDYQRANGGRLGSNLVKLGIISDDVITAVLSRQYGVPSINLELFQIEEETIKLISQDVALKYAVLPVSKVGATLTLAMADPTNVFAMDDIKFMTGLNVEPVVASEASILASVAKYYATSKELELAGVSINGFEKPNLKSSKNGNGATSDQKLVDSDLNVSLDVFDFHQNEASDLEVLEENEEIDLAMLAKASEDAPVVRLVNVLLVDSLRRGASDIHVEPYEKDFRIRFRIDGVLYDVMHPPMKMRDALISRLKIMAKLDISEKRLPQDGRIKIKVKIDNRSRELDFRVSTLPTLFGEKVVLRLLDKEKLMLDMTKLGFEPESLKLFQRNIAKPYGMVLVTGPTGSGKTNTLYSALQSLNTPETNIMTAEDPVEFNLPGINQVQMKEQIGLNFAAALRSFLRQDPNIVLVGEIRDFETAEIAIKAALTGHLVFTTVHANNVIDVIGRFLNMNVDLYNFVAALNCVLAQRLVRKLCPTCKRVYVPSDAEILESGLPLEVKKEHTFLMSVGCDACNHTGYRGRTAIHELLDMSDTIREMIIARKSGAEIRRQAEKEGLSSLRKAALKKVYSGMTTLYEINRVTFVEELR